MLPTMPLCGDRHGRSRALGTLARIRSMAFLRRDQTSAHHIEISSTNLDARRYLQGMLSVTDIGVKDSALVDKMRERHSKVSQHEWRACQVGNALQVTTTHHTLETTHVFPCPCQTTGGGETNLQPVTIQYRTPMFPALRVEVPSGTTAV